MFNFIKQSGFIMNLPRSTAVSPIRHFSGGVLCSPSWCCRFGCRLHRPFARLLLYQKGEQSTGESMSASATGQESALPESAHVGDGVLDGGAPRPPSQILPVSLKALPSSEVGLTVALHIAPRLFLCMPRVCCALETSQ